MSTAVSGVMAGAPSHHTVGDLLWGRCAGSQGCAAGGGSGHGGGGGAQPSDGPADGVPATLSLAS